MEAELKTGVWLQYGAALDTLDDALNLCPDHLWTGQLWPDPEDERFGQVWYIASHTLVWTGLFQTGSSQGFVPPPPFIRGRLPDQPYTKEHVQAYLVQLRREGQSIIEGLTDEKARQTCRFDWMEPNFLELQLYAMRHIQEHAAQLN